MPGSIRFQKLRNVRHKRVIGIGVGEKRTNGKQDLADGQCGTPLILQDVKADASVRIDVAVVNPGGKVHFRWLEGIVRWKMNVKEEYTACIGGFIRSHNSSLPVEHVVADWACRAVGWGVLSQVHQFCFSQFIGK